MCGYISSPAASATSFTHREIAVSPTGARREESGEGKRRSADPELARSSPRAEVELADQSGVSVSLVRNIEQARQVGDVRHLARVLGSLGLGFDEALGRPRSTAKAAGDELEVVSVEQTKSTFLVRARGKAPQPERGTPVAIRGRVSQVPHGTKPGHVTIHVDRPRLVTGEEEP